MTEARERIDQDTIERARNARSLTSLVARRVKLLRAGRGWKGLCPFHKEKSPSFTVSDEKGFYHCFGCGAHGDAIRWLTDAEGLGFLDAVKSLLGGDLPDARRAITPAERERLAEPSNYVESATAGRWIFRTSGPARGEIVERYLAARGLNPAFEPLPGFPAIDQLRFHPRCPVSAWKVDADPADARLTAPAMVVPIRDVDGAVWGVEVTWLSPDGRGHAALPTVQGKPRPKRKIFGAVARNAAFLTPVERVNGDNRTPLLVGEGFETTWSAAEQLGRPCRAVAALNLNNLQGGVIRLRGGAIPLWKPQPDPDSPPFLLAQTGEVIVAVDADMKPLRDQLVQRARGERPVKADLGAMDRAKLCADLATGHWRRAGVNKVSAIRPKMGWDFNDAAVEAAVRGTDDRQHARAA